MSEANVPASVSGPQDAPAAGNETVGAGAMHLSGSSHADAAGMQFLGAAPLQVDFVDLHAVASTYWVAGPISFATLAESGMPGGATVPASAPGPDTRPHQQAGSVLADFSTGMSSGVPGAAMPPDAAGRTGGAGFAAPRPVAQVWIGPLPGTS